MSTQDGGSAFPCQRRTTDAERQAAATYGGKVEATTFDAGMSLRDYFAAQTIPVYLSLMYSNVLRRSENHTESHAAAAKWSYEMADAMLQERAK